ncbi:MAG TPA: exosortase-associated EpsI family protein [Verrucomicrobiae bacterium]|nr:exosortase-associated EpsI family protein [Verrucomicrobiae bacterium]
MNKRSMSILLVSLALIGATSSFIQYRKTHQRLGAPGVKVAAVPIYDPDGRVAGTNSVLLPEVVADFKSKVQPVQRMVLEWLPPDTTYGQRSYTAADNFEIQCSAILMGADRTSIHKPKYCLNGTGWRINGEEPDTVTVSRPHTYQLPVTRMPIRRDLKLSSGQTVEVHGWYVYWFVAENQLTADHNQRMWWLARDLIRTGVLQRWAYLSCMAVCLPGQDDQCYRRIKDFIAEAVPQFQLTQGPEIRLASAEKPQKP